MAEGESRQDRELIELLNELRVALPGVQVLFAFLLTVPFTQRFPSLTDLERDAYFLAFVCSAISTVFFIAPTAFHRIQWRERDKEYMLRISNRFAIVGMVFLTIGMTSVVFLITEFIFGLGWGAFFAAAIGGLFTWFWFGLPLTRHAKGERGK